MADGLTLVYARVSTQEQTAGVSMDDQIARAKAYCGTLGIRWHPDHVQLCREEGVSGSVPLDQRPKGQNFAKRIRAGGVANVVAFKLDRLFRDASNALEVTKEWDKLGVALHLLDLGGQAINTRSAMGRFMLTVVAGAAEMERNLIRERTSSALQHKKARGDRLGPPAFGVVKGKEPNADELVTVKLILSLRKRDPSRWSYREIAARLTAEGHKTKRGGKWNPKTVKSVWDRRSFYGAML